MESTAALNGKSWTPRLFGLAMMLLGVAGWWYNWHLATSEGKFWIKLCVFVPLALSGGLLFLLRPEWAGPWRQDNPRGQKAATLAVLAFMAIGSGVEFFRLHREISRQEPQQKVIAWSPEKGRPNLSARPTIPVSLSAPAAPLAMSFLGKPYRLGSFNQRHNGMWEFVTGGETVANWTTLLTVIDRPDARTRADLDRLAEGILSTYRSRGARVLLAKTMGSSPETVFNYAVVAFDEPNEHRIELDFVKVQLGSDHAAVVVYGVRVNDAQDYRAKAKEFLDAHSSRIGRELEGLALPDVSALPRREF